MENPKEENTGKKLRNAAKYSAIGFQMIATISLLTFIGHKIDQHRSGKLQIYTAIFGLIGVAIALYQAIKQATKE